MDSTLLNLDEWKPLEQRLKGDGKQKDERVERWMEMPHNQLHTALLPNWLK